jgi:mannose-6-phosphate isomerase-like protein (cupin superfamily)
LSKRHPFDLALVRIPKGKSLCPYHAHAAESELYLVVSGRGNVRDKNGIAEVGPGDAFLFQPGEPHQLTNGGDEDFVYYVIADNPRSGGSNRRLLLLSRTAASGRSAEEESEELIVKELS